MLADAQDTIDISRLVAVSTAFLTVVAQESEAGRALGKAGDMNEQQKDKHGHTVKSTIATMQAMTSEARNFASDLLNGTKTFDATRITPLLHSASQNVIHLAEVWAEIAMREWGHERTHRLLTAAIAITSDDEQQLRLLQMRHLARVCKIK